MKSKFFLFVLYSFVPLFSQSYSYLKADQFTWTGKIVKQDNTPSSNAIVLAYINDNNKKYVLSTNTDANGNLTFNQLSTSVEKDYLPINFELYQNYPNPFNPSTIIKYDVREAGNVKLEIYNALGQHVKTLVDKVNYPGRYEVTWQGDNDRNEGVAAGVYLYRLMIGGKQIVKKMLLIDGNNSGHLNAHGPNAGGIDEAMFFDAYGTGSTIDSIQVFGPTIQKRTFTNPNWKNMPASYALGTFKVLENGWNELDVGPLVSLGFNTPLKDFQVRLGSDPNVKALTDANGMAYLYTTKTGKDSVLIVGPSTITNGVDSTYYFYTHPEVVINPGVNKVTDFNSSNIETWKRWKDEFGRDLLQGMIDWSDVKQFVGFPEFKNCTILFPSSDITIYFDRINKPAGYTDAYIDSMFFHSKKEFESIDEPGMVKFSISETTDKNQPGVVTAFTNTSGNWGNTYATKETMFSKGRYILFAAIDLTPYPLPTIKYAQQNYIHEFVHALLAASPFHSTNKEDALYIPAGARIKKGLSNLEKKIFAHLYTLGYGKKLMRRN
jgi:flagellar hook assembly protein FlgD